MTIFSVRHVTTYRYRQPVSFGEHRMMFRPRDSYDQRLIEAKLSITPDPAYLRWMHDVFGNCVATAGFTGRCCELRFESEICLSTRLRTFLTSRSRSTPKLIHSSMVRRNWTTSCRASSPATPILISN
jgi:hypothetical protein